jgi:hypothetical protein
VLVWHAADPAGGYRLGEMTEKTDEDSRSNRRPIELIGSPACQRSQISDR